MNLLDLTPPAARAALERWIAERGEPAYRVRQILPRLWQRPIGHWRDATDLPTGLRAALAADFPLPRPTLRSRQRSVDGTEKYLWDFGDGGLVESVLIPERRRRTLCVSSQAGCAYGCVFCATGRMGFERHLAPWEITAQLRELRLESGVGVPGNVVFMGMGEPLHNWDAVDRALTILNATDGFGIGARHITVSTIGVVPKLERLASRPEQFRVALSLHAPTSEQRARLMPVERKYPLSLVLDTLRRFPKRVTFEYVMIAGVNDATDDARRLGDLALEVGAHVNLLPLHPGGTPDLTPTQEPRIRAFAAGLRRAGVNVTVRASRGLDIAAACGQLRTELGGRLDVAAQVDAHVE